MFGWQAAEAVGRNVSILMPNPYCEEHDSYLARYLATGERHVIGLGREALGRRKDGTVFALDLSIAEARIGGDRGFLGTIRDISGRRKMEEWFRLVVESAPNAILVIDAAGKIFLVNSQAERYFGYPRAEMLGQPVEILLPERFRGVHADYRSTYCAAPEA